MSIKASVLFALACACGTAYGVPREITVTPTADTTIYLGEGFSDQASNALGENLSVGQTADGVTRRSLIRFDLSGIAPGSIVESAQLTLFESRSRSSYNVALHRLLAAWGEGTSSGGSGGQSSPVTPGDATWISAHWVGALGPNVLWGSPGGAFVTSPSASVLVGGAGSTYAWSSNAMNVMLDDVRMWVDMPSSNHGWILIGEETVSQNAKLFSSRQSNFAPALVLQVSPVPEPASYVFMVAGLGLIGLLLRRRRETTTASAASVAA